MFRKMRISVDMPRNSKLPVIPTIRQYATVTTIMEISPGIGAQVEITNAPPALIKRKAIEGAEAVARRLCALASKDTEIRIATNSPRKALNAIQPMLVPSKVATRAPIIIRMRPVFANIPFLVSPSDRAVSVEAARKILTACMTPKRPITECTSRYLSE